MEKEVFKRGCLTEKAKKISIELFGREIGQFELRLFPYLDYCLKNGGILNVFKLSTEELFYILNNEDIKITEKSIDGKDYELKITVTKEFYDIMQEFLWECYVEKNKGVAK